MSQRFYITTAIDYVNGQPHLGHAYEKVITDVIARGQRALGRETFYLTGLDEHGQKVQQAAQAENKPTQAYCDELAQVWEEFARALRLSYDGFVRTTSDFHKATVTAILKKLFEEGHFYRAEYSGFYSTRAETFLTDRDRLPDGSFDPSFGEVIQLKESNYYFKLKDHQSWLIDLIEANPDFIYPGYRRNEVLGLLKNNELEDLCISRPVNRLNWGIPLPFDPDYVTYVWFDALVNYISYPARLGDQTVIERLHAQEEGFQVNDASDLWPANAHVIGKDILKFHAVYWPIMLKAMDLPLPRQILAHGWWQKDGAKISKSTGNIVEPLAVIREWGVDAFRYYIVRELDLGPDGNWTDSGFASRYQAELANGLGNLVNRSLSMLKRYRQKTVPPTYDELAAEARETVEKTADLLKQYRLQDALIQTWSLIARANQYVDQTAPFKLAKDPDQAKRLDEVLYNLAEICRILAVLIWPFIPDSAEKIYAQLNLSDKPDRFEKAQWGGLEPGHLTADPAPLFPRKDLPVKTTPSAD